MSKTDTIQAVLSDLHTGSIHALTIERPWQGERTAIIHPRSKQVEIRKHFNKYAEKIKHARKGKALRVVVDGDAIDGVHHDTPDIFTRDVLEQADLHIEIMTDFKKRIGWQRGDELYYVKGTEVHTNDMENYIGKELGAIQQGNHYAFDTLDLETNGVLSRFVHHGPGAGAGANEGNALRNWLKAIYYDALKDGDRFPDITYTGHVHNPTYATFETRKEMTYRVMHGIILPSFQEKTRYAHMRAPASKNKIGGVIHEIKADGTICTPEFVVG